MLRKINIVPHESPNVVYFVRLNNPLLLFIQILPQWNLHERSAALLLQI